MTAEEDAFGEELEAWRTAPRAPADDFVEGLEDKITRVRNLATANVEAWTLAYRFPKSPAGHWEAKKSLDSWQQVLDVLDGKLDGD